MSLFDQLATQPAGTKVNRDDWLSAVCWNADGLIPAIAQDKGSHAVLMMAWMNREALLKTLETGEVHYFSRSRQTLWRKGETSGNTQTLSEAHIDCDGDALLLRVTQKGAACHTNRPTCFAYRVDSHGLVVDSV